MTNFPTRTRIETWAGLWLAATAWAANMEIGQILPGLDCAHGVRHSAWVSFALTILALAAGSISWRRVRATPVGVNSPGTLRFAAKLSALSALAFAFALALQTVATLVLTGCER